MCEFCESEGAILYQQTASTKLMIESFGNRTTLLVECEPWELRAHHVPVRSRFIINFCPNCGRDLRKKWEDYDGKSCDD